MDFIKHPILVAPFLKCCTYIENQEYKNRNIKIDN